MDIPKEKLQKLIDAAEYDLKVRQELIDKGELDSNSYNSQMRAVHESNLKILQNFLSQYSWPIPSRDGKEAFEAAWLIAIHAIEHPEQMIEARDKIKQLLDQGEQVAHEYACLFDRIALYSGDKQRYGTQFWPSTHGWHLKDLEGNESSAERYRAQIGMQSLKERWQEMAEYKDEPGVIDTEEEAKQNKSFEEFLQKSAWVKYRRINN